MLVGLAAGVLAFAFAFAVGEPQIQRAIEFEEQLAASHHEAGQAEIVTRGTQETWGLLTGTVLMGVALGGLFSLVFAYAYGRMAQLGPRATAGAPGARRLRHDHPRPVHQVPGQPARRSARRRRSTSARSSSWS